MRFPNGSFFFSLFFENHSKSELGVWLWKLNTMLLRWLVTSSYISNKWYCLFANSQFFFFLLFLLLYEWEFLWDTNSSFTQHTTQKLTSCNELQAQRYTSNPYPKKNRKRGSQTTIEQSTLFMNHDRIFKILA